MAELSLATDAALRAACEYLSKRENWEEERLEWVRQLAATIQWVREADEQERSTRGFQARLWEDNSVSAIGQGNISVDRALDDADFRHWLAARSMEPLPAAGDARLQFLTLLYEDLKKKVEPFVRKYPHLKIFRVICTLYPEGMTTIASAGALDELTRAMGAGRRLDLVERHVWVRERLDRLLGLPSNDPMVLAERISLPWMLYARFVKAEAKATEEVTKPGGETKLVPLPAARRRRGLTAIRGFFPAVLSILEFVRDGVTRAELLDFLRAASPEAKETSLGVTINVLQGELAVVRSDGTRYVLTERGEDVLESQDPSHLSDWILTRILGADKLLVELRERGTLESDELISSVRAMNPGWTTTWVPQSLVKWFRSMGVVETAPSNRLALTELGRQWASRIYWDPEPLPSESSEPERLEPLETGMAAELPELAAILSAVKKSGHFPDGVVAQLHAGLWAHSRRHFAILTGLSGSGKTLLAREYAKALAPAGSLTHLLTLPVQPGWYDPAPLLGYPNPLRRDSYVRTSFLEFLTTAGADPAHPYVVVLDEMNLSHPEQYMAPMLSAMETGEPIRLHTEGDYFDGVPDLLPYPKNLVLIGTVNMDETTHGLSDKVLDRAFVLEFWTVDLKEYPRWDERHIEPAVRARAQELLMGLMDALSPARLHFGWRVVDDVLDFLERSSGAGDILQPDEALDTVVYAKVLPKLRGEDAPRFREALERCEGVLTSFGLEKSRVKVKMLRSDLETTGSARFWR